MRLLVLLVLVLLAHALVLDWLARRLVQPAALRPLAPPMFTRLLQPQAPAAQPAPPAPPPARARPTRPAVTAIAKSGTARAPRPPASAAQAPAPVPEIAASAPDASTAPAQVPPYEAPAEPQPVPEVASSTPETSATATTQAAAPPAAAGSAPVANLDSWPVDTRLNYQLSGYFRGDLHGSALVQWQREHNRYQVRVEVDLVLLSVALTSQGEVLPHGLSPSVFEELRPNRVRAVRLSEDKITLNDGSQVPRPAGVQDTASQFVELSHRFATGREGLEVGRSIEVWLARPGAVDLWTYDVVARETLQTPGFGAIEAFHLKPRPLVNPRGNITAEMWFAPSLQYLPVRILVKMGDEARVDLMVEKIEQR